MAGGLAGGCGHLAFDELPLPGNEGPDGATNPSDAGPGNTDDGSVVLDASLDGDAADRDGGCGADCPGPFVSGIVGNDSNPGTAQAPVKTITKGIAIAKALGGKRDVIVAAAQYPEKVTLVDTISLVGGFNCSVLPCAWQRDVANNDTVILAQDSEGVLAPATVTRVTRLEGFRVVGKEGSPIASTVNGTAAISILGGTPTITRCRIHGADSVGIPTTKRSIGVAIVGTSNTPKGALLDLNIIGGGAAIETSFGVFIDSLGGNGAPIAVLKGNTIRGGSAPFTVGVHAPNSAAGTVLQNNDIIAGTSNGNSGNIGSWGISVGSVMTIDGNLINANNDPATIGSCPSNVTGFCGGIQSLSSATTITNNVVFGIKSPRSCAVMLTEAERAAGAVVLNGNTLDGAGNGADGVSAAVALGVGLGNTVTIGKVRNNILQGGLNKARYGVYEVGAPGKTIHLAALEHNVFWNVLVEGENTYAYRAWTGSVGQDLTLLELTTPTPTATNNQLVDPQLDATFHLQATSPCINAGIATEAPPQDRDGQGRPKGPAIDIGADEAQ